MPRILRSSISFAVVVVAYWAYALLAVPWIEPQAQRQNSRDRFERDRMAARQDMRRRLHELEGIFPAGSWALENAKILQSEQVKLLIRDYSNLGDGRVEIRPCAMVYTPDGPAQTAEERKRQSVVLEAPEGALLQFDSPFDLGKAKIGRLVKGRLKGRITIRSDNKLPGPQDDLLVVTRDVDISEHAVSTPFEVEFRYGPNHGRGRQMLIKLLPGDPASAGQGPGPSIGGVELFEIKQLERLHLDFGDQGLLPAQPSLVPRRPGAAAAPIEISCRGPFRFRPVQQLITFEDRVDVLRLHPNGPGDQLNCETLAIYLARPRGGVPGRVDAKGKMSGTLDLQPRRIEARGRPVVVRAPSQDLDVRGERLEYDFQAARILLDGQGEVVLRQGANEIHAVSVQYQSAGPGRLGQAAAQGPGWLRAKVADRNAEPLGARWNGLLRLRPDEGRQAISLTGGAELTYGAVGQLNAGEIHFWFFEPPPGASAGPASPAKQPQLQPDRMLARQQVRLQAAQLSAAVDELGVWFQVAARGGPPGAPNSQPASSATAGTGPVSAPAGAPQAPGAAIAAASGEPPKPQQHFDVVGNLLRCRLLLRQEAQTAAELSELMVDGNVRFQETQVAQPNEQPLLVTGDRIQVLDADKPCAAVTVTGSPAHFEYRGLGLTGTNINLNRGTNRLWIDGAGQMDLSVDRDLEGRPLSGPQAMQIQWQRQMNFDGRTAHFEETVVASNQLQRLRTESLNVSLRRSIRFDAEAARQQPQLEEIRCAGGALMEGQTFDGQGPLSRDTLQVVDLRANLISGDTRASGPGWMTSVRWGTSDPMAARSPQPAGAPGDPTGPAQNELMYLNVRFQGAIAGNLHRKEMAFEHQVKTTYGPVDSWDAKLDPDCLESLGTRGIFLSCDRLAVVQMPSPTGQRPAVEMEATGNTLVENPGFTARALRMTYSEAKDLLVLEGDGRTDAELSAQKYVGGPVSNFAARKILYWPSTRRLSVDGVRSLELNDLPALSRRPKP